MGRPRREVPNFQLRQAPSGIWEVRWTEAGKTKTKTTSETDYRKAEQALHRHIALVQSPKLPDDPPLSSLIAEYKRLHFRNIARPASQSYALAPIEERLGASRPSEITDIVLADYAQWRRSQPVRGRIGTQVSDGTIAREVNALRAVLFWASRNGLTKHHPAIRQPVSLPEGRQRFLTNGELERLLAAAKPLLHLDLFIRIAIATAARRSAILELTWDRVTWPQVGGAISWKRNEEIEFEYLNPGLFLDMGRGVGNKRRAIVPVGDNPPLYRRLRQAQKIARTTHVIEWGGSPVRDIKTAFIRACSTAGIENCTPHVLKHTAISRLVQSGMPLGTIATLTKTSVGTLQKHYAHLSPEVVAQIGEALTV